MSVLLITERDDIHAHALTWALKRQGVRCDRWSLSDFPENRKTSVRIRDSQLPPVIDVSGLPPGPYESIWTRRVGSPRALADTLAPADVPMALLQARRYSDGLREIFSPESAWINPPEARGAANAKPRQLLAARQAGFTIPDTLLSNDPEQIRAFFREHQGNVIYKGFTPAFWENRERGTISCLFTTKLTEEALEEDAAFTSCPGIYQIYVPKKADVRVTFFGATYCAARIYSQVRGHGSVDFRSDLKAEAPMEPFEMDSELLRKCTALTSQLGLLHGSYDFVEQPDGTMTFLEINEMGQFLWLEERLPELPLLSMFAAFSLDPRKDFMFDSQRAPRVSFREFLGTCEYAEFRRYLDNRPPMPFHWFE